MAKNWTEDEMGEAPGWTLVQLGNALGREFTRCLNTVGLTPTQFGALVQLRAGAVDSQAELARRLLVTPQSANELLEILIERRLIERDGPGGRGRKARLSVTEEGRRVLDQATNAVGHLVGGQLPGLTAAETATLQKLARKTLDAHG